MLKKVYFLVVEKLEINLVLICTHFRPKILFIIYFDF